MAISRALMRRQLRSQGGIMQLEPRQQYGLGSLVKSITKPIKKAVSAVGDFVSSDIGKMALLAAGGYYLGGLGGATGLSRFSPAAMKAGLLGTVEAGTGLYGGGVLSGLMNTGVGQAIAGGLSSKALGTGAAILGGSALMSSLFGSPEQAKQLYSERPSVVKNYLAQYYRNVNRDRDVTDEEVEQFVNEQTREYAANGGRIGFQEGGSFDFNKFLQDRTREAMQVEGIGQAIKPVVESNVRAQAARDLSQAARGGGIESFLRGKLGSGIIPGVSAMQSPMSGISAFGRQQVLDALTKAYMKPYSMPTGSVYDQMRFAQPGQSGSFVEMEGGQFGDGMGIVIDGKRYATEQEAIDDVGIEKYNMFYAKGGRVGFEEGGTFLTMEEAKKRDPAMFMDTTTYNPIPADADRQGAAEIAKVIMGTRGLPREEGEIEDDSVMSSTQFIFEKYVIPKRKELMENFGLSLQEADDLIREEMAKLRDKKADGGMPTGIMRTNQAGIMERDYRDEGGFVPVGIKEKADDVPAMLSKNEFVFTADAVRGAGNGDVEKGAQRMYKVMKTLENGGTV